jgi:fibronectin-binding autotransporter adhesin
VTVNPTGTFSPSQMEAPDDGGNGYGFTMAGPGVLFLGTIATSGLHAQTPVNVFTGPVTISGGILKVASVYALNRNNVVSIDTGGSLGLQDLTFAVAGVDDLNPSSTGSIIDTTGGGVLTLAGQGSYRFSGNITGSFMVNKSGSGTQTLSGISAFTNSNLTPSLIISSGTLNLDFSGPVSTAPNQVSGQALPMAGQDILYHVSDPESATAPINSATNMAGGTLMLSGLAGASNVQRFGSIGLSGGASKIKLVAAASNSVLLSTGNMGAFSNTVVVGGGTTVGATLDFTLPAGAQSATNGVLTTASNVNGILGGSFTVGGSDWATVSGATHQAVGTTPGTPGTWDNGTVSGDGSEVSIYTATQIPAGSSVSFNTVSAGSGLTAGRLYYVVDSNPASGTYPAYFKVTANPGATTPVSPSGTSGTLTIDTQGNVVPFTAYLTNFTGLSTAQGSTDVATGNYLITGSIVEAADNPALASDVVNSLKIANTAPASLDVSANVGGLM